MYQYTGVFYNFNVVLFQLQTKHIVYNFLSTGSMKERNRLWNSWKTSSCWWQESLLLTESWAAWWVTEETADPTKCAWQSCQRAAYPGAQWVAVENLLMKQLMVSEPNKQKTIIKYYTSEVTKLKLTFKRLTLKNSSWTLTVILNCCFSFSRQNGLFL